MDSVQHLSNDYDEKITANQEQDIRVGVNNLSFGTLIDREKSVVKQDSIKELIRSPSSSALSPKVQLPMPAYYRSRGYNKLEVEVPDAQRQVNRSMPRLAPQKLPFDANIPPGTTTG